MLDHGLLVLGEGSTVFQVRRCSSRWKSPVAIPGGPASATHPNVCRRLKSSWRSTRPSSRCQFRANQRVVRPPARIVPGAVRVGRDDRRSSVPCCAHRGLETVVDRAERL
jgi:hypothetical protein